MLDPVAAELSYRPVIHSYGEVDGKLSLAVAENHAHAVVQRQAVGGGVELGKRGLQRVRGGSGLRLDDHAFPLLPIIGERVSLALASALRHADADAELERLLVGCLGLRLGTVSAGFQLACLLSRRRRGLLEKVYFGERAVPS